MATYPRFSTVDTSTCTVAGGHDAQRATNGALRLRRYWTEDKREFDLQHVLTAGEQATLAAFYAANKDLDVDYVSPWDRATYAVRFVAPPQFTPRGFYFEARVRLQQV